MNSNRTGRRIFAVVSLTLSVIVLLLAVGGIIGVWVTRGPVIETIDSVVESVAQFSQAGQEGVDRLDGRLIELRRSVAEVETAIDALAQNVEEQGVVVTLLPPETEQRLQTTTQQVTDALTSIADVVRAVIQLADTIGRLPFVNLPEPNPQQVASLESEVEEIRAGVEQLESEIRRFREGAASEIAALSTTTTNIDTRLEAAQDELSQLDSRLERLVAEANRLRQQLVTAIGIIVVVLTLLQGWVAYAMVRLIGQEWAALQQSRADLAS